MKNAGFTLIEVMVALAIVTIGMAALLGTLSSAAGTTAYLQDKTLAEWIALNQVETVRLKRTVPSKGDSDGEVEFAGRKWKWSQTIADMQIPGVLRIDVKVRPSDVVASQDNAWFATVSGVIGNAVGVPKGDQPAWIGSQLGAPGGAGGTSQTTPQTPGTTLTPGTSTPGQVTPTPFNPTAPPVPK